MGKILAIIFLIVFAWVAIPKIAQAQWFAPTLQPSYWWGDPIYTYQQQTAQRGYGWVNVNFWRGQPSINAGYQPSYSGGYYGNTYYGGGTYYSGSQIPYGYRQPSGGYYGSTYLGNGGYYGNSWY